MTVRLTEDHDRCEIINCYGNKTTFVRLYSFFKLPNTLGMHPILLFLEKLNHDLDR